MLGEAVVLRPREGFPSKFSLPQSEFTVLLGEEEQPECGIARKSQLRALEQDSVGNSSRSRKRDTLEARAFRVVVIATMLRRTHAIASNHS